MRKTQQNFKGDHARLLSENGDNSGPDASLSPITRNEKVGGTLGSN